MASNSNLYSSPASDAGKHKGVQDSREIAMRRVRIATMIGMLAPIFEYVLFLIDGVRHEWWQGELGGLFVACVLFGAVAIAGLFTVGWFLAYPILRAASHVIHYLFARNVPIYQWQTATDNALWTLPYAAILGVFTWLVYSICSRQFIWFGGWPEDLIFGSLGNIIAAWFYITLFVYWIKIYQQIKLSAADPNSTG